MLNEGYRVVFINYNYNTTTGKLKYAASIFRRNKCLVTGFAFEDLENDGQIYYASDAHDAQPYYEITEQDVANHMHTTDSRFEIRPVKLTFESGLSYEELIYGIRWEMCHGYGCKGPRKQTSSRPESPESTCSDNSFLSTDSQPEITPGLAHSRTVHCVRHCGPDRDIFIAFKGRSSTGEIAYGAAIHRRRDPDSRLSDTDVDNHYKTAAKRLETNPVVLHLDDDYMEFSHQLKRSANHREDVTQLMVDNIFTRRGGKIQVRAY